MLISVIGERHILAVVDDCERLIEMKLSLVSEPVDSVIIVEPVGTCAALLHLEDKIALADGMDRPRRNKEYISFMRWNEIQYIRHGSVCYSTSKLIFGHVFIKSDI